MPINAATPAAARGSERAAFLRICSRDSCEGALGDALFSDRVDQDQEAPAQLRVGDLRDQLGRAQVDSQIARLQRPESLWVATTRQRGDDGVADRGQGRLLCIAQRAADCLSGTHRRRL